MKQGLYTTEFWLTIVTILCATVTLIVRAIDANTWLFVVTGSSGLYNVSRGIAKIGPTKSVEVNTDKATVNTTTTAAE